MHGWSQHLVMILLAEGQLINAGRTSPAHLLLYLHLLV